MLIKLSNPQPASFYGCVAKIGGRQTFSTHMIATQIAGLMPMQNEPDCRPSACYCNKIFDTDKSSFLFESLGELTFSIQKYGTKKNNQTDNYGVDLSKARKFRAVSPFCIQKNTTYPPYTPPLPRTNTTANNWQSMGIAPGKIYPFGGFSQQPYYSGIEIDWEQVFKKYGEGFYRLSVLKGTQSIQSVCFYLQKFSCEAANNTVYVKSELNHTLGDVMNQEKEFFLKGLHWQDYARYPGRLSGHQFDYEETTYHLAKGHIVSDERLHRSRAVLQYNLKLYRLPMELVSRLFAYGLVDAQISDFNHPAVSTTFKNLKVIRSAAPEINYDHETVSPYVSATIKLRNKFDNNLLTNYY